MSLRDHPRAAAAAAGSLGLALASLLYYSKRKPKKSKSLVAERRKQHEERKKERLSRPGSTASLPALGVDADDVKSPPSTPRPVREGLEGKETKEECREQPKLDMKVTHGPISGEVTPHTIVLLARAAEPGPLRFVVSRPGTEGSPSVWVCEAVVQVSRESDCAGKVLVKDLQPSTSYEYAVGGRKGRFRTAPAKNSVEHVSFVFGGGIGGHGLGRPAEGAWPIFHPMKQANADFFILLGDSIYADAGIPADDGRFAPGQAKPCVDFASFCSRYRYHLDDRNYARFLRSTPAVVTWDSHEVMEGWAGAGLPEADQAYLQAATSAFFTYWPLQGQAPDPTRIYRSFRYGKLLEIFILDTRSYRSPTVQQDIDVFDPADPAKFDRKRVPYMRTMLGAAQLAWLKQGLTDSTAVWKVIVSSAPLSYPVGNWPNPEVTGYDGWACAGADKELRGILDYIRLNRVKNFIFITGGAHFPYALSYDPWSSGAPAFYEFGVGPLQAVPSAPLRPMESLGLGATVLYGSPVAGSDDGDATPADESAAEVEPGCSTAGGHGLNFGHIDVTEQGQLVFRVLDRAHKELFVCKLQPQQHGIMINPSALAAAPRLASIANPGR